MAILIGTPHTKGAGYYCNDQDLRTRQEADVQVCAHCRAIIKMQEWQKRGAWCPQEMKPLCLNCGMKAQTEGCIPFMQKLEAAFEQSLRPEQQRPAEQRPLIIISRS